MLEATMMIIDNSEFMRNGDYTPTRLEAQADAATTVFTRKTDSNPENTVGLMTMAGQKPEVLVTHSKDMGQILAGLHSASGKVGGEADIPTALSIAQLALKHRQNKNLRQRIIVFVGSPLGADQQGLVRLAKRLKKNNVAVDVVCFGEHAAQDGSDDESLKAFVETVTSSDNSHLVTVPAGPRALISDAIISSPILAGDGVQIDETMGGDAAAAAGGAGRGAANNFEFGVDPSLDPELAMALRMSMEEERTRQAQPAASTSSAPANMDTDAGTSSAPAASTGASVPPAADLVAPQEEDEDEELKRALAMSTAPQDVDMAPADEAMDEDEDEEAAIARAIAMSMEGEGDEKDQKS